MKSEHFKVVGDLIKAGGDVHAKNNAGQTAYTLAPSKFKNYLDGNLKYIQFSGSLFNFSC